MKDVIFILMFLRTRIYVAVFDVWIICVRYPDYMPFKHLTTYRWLHPQCNSSNICQRNFVIAASVDLLQHDQYDCMLFYCALSLCCHYAVIDRDCWPVTDKKDEQLFRKKCTSWLEQIVRVSVIVLCASVMLLYYCRATVWETEPTA